MRRAVSVVMPVYNVADYVAAAVESVLRQTSCGFELIIVDEGSTDATRDIADRFRDPRVRLIAGSHPSAMVGLILPRGWHDFLERAALKTTRA